MGNEAWKDVRPERPTLFVPGEKDRSFEKLDDAAHQAIRAEYGTDNIQHLQASLSPEGVKEFEKKFGRLDQVVDRTHQDVHQRDRERADRIHALQQIQNLQKEWNRVVATLLSKRNYRDVIAGHEADILAKPIWKKLFELPELHRLRSYLAKVNLEIAAYEAQAARYGAALKKYGHSVPADTEPFVPLPSENNL